MSMDDLVELASFCDNCGGLLGKYICPALPGSPFKQLCRACARIELSAAYYGGWEEYCREHGGGERWCK